ncbi:MAG TPA: hypothetical protein VNC59_03530 [Thermoanaerobaculia bacterium]|nr:hypothetical protein [Thermoanaerobaculia bacterium]
MPRDRSRLWDSFKRALGGSPPSNDGEPELTRASDSTLPFLAPDEPPEAAAAPEPPMAPPPAEATVVSVAGPSMGTEAGVAETPDALPIPPSAAPLPETEGARPPRLARGLASFSRHNADREKKFRHILSDGETGKKK